MTHTQQLPWVEHCGESLTEAEGPRCKVCGFELWIPIAALRVSHVGLYDDARFPGRLIVSLNEHIEHFDDVQPELLTDFMADLQDASLVLRKMVDDVARVNMAVLGNKAPHVHAHLIPRRMDDHNYGVSPWEDAVTHRPLEAAERTEIAASLKDAFGQLSRNRQDGRDLTTVGTYGSVVAPIPTRTRWFRMPFVGR
ncbi:HIT family protein [Mycobacterium asiaticum]|uniref:HIT family protein n=1 Tax=Mycobacterium asiaticum TaxID=1790 RepID=UPI0009BCE6C9|nr:HIT domain-containing protein [Mycobacterium asiaticum]